MRPAAELWSADMCVCVCVCPGAERHPTHPGPPPLTHPPDVWVQVPPPTAHALLVCAAITVAGNLSPAAHTKGLDQLDKLGILLWRPLVTPDVGVHLQQWGQGTAKCAE